jgi:hypothetical protein
VHPVVLNQIQATEEAFATLRAAVRLVSLPLSPPAPLPVAALMVNKVREAGCSQFPIPALKGSGDCRAAGLGGGFFPGGARA